VPAICIPNLSLRLWCALSFSNSTAGLLSGVPGPCARWNLKLYSAPYSLRRDDMQMLIHRRTCHVVFFMPGGNGSEGPSSSLSTLSIVAQIFGSGFAIWSMLSNCSQSPCAQSALSAFVCTVLLFWVRSWLVRPRAIARRLRRDPEPIVGVWPPDDVTFDAMS
jgi:hypothetical protein